MSAHPPADRLDALAAGEEDAALAEHLAECASCKSYVETLRAAAFGFAGEPPSPPEFARKVADRADTIGGAKPSKGKTVRRMFFAAAPVLAAAAVAILVLRARPPDPVPGEDVPEPAASAAGMRFKGTLPIAVVRQRGAAQERFAGKVSVRPGDALRLELSLDRERSISAGLLGEDGSFVELIAPKKLPPGTHFSDLAARFDDHPTRGWLIAGDPDSVEQARKSRGFERLTAIYVEVEP
jgi:hypothetical protein